MTSNHTTLPWAGDGWPFLISRNQTLDYRVVVAPRFMSKNTCVLQQHTCMELEKNIFHVTVLNDPDAGNLTFIYRIIEAAGDTGKLYDEYYRPILCIEGVVLTGSKPDLVPNANLFDAIHVELQQCFQNFFQLTTPTQPEYSQYLSVESDIGAGLPGPGPTKTIPPCSTSRKINLPVAATFFSIFVVAILIVIGYYLDSSNIHINADESSVVTDNSVANINKVLSENFKRIDLQKALARSVYIQFDLCDKKICRKRILILPTVSEGENIRKAFLNQKIAEFVSLEILRSDGMKTIDQKFQVYYSPTINKEGIEDIGSLLRRNGMQYIVFSSLRSNGDDKTGDLKLHMHDLSNEKAYTEHTEIDDTKSIRVVLDAANLIARNMAGRIQVHPE